MGLWPVAVYFAAVILVVAAMLMLSYVLGQRHMERATAEPYESGMPAVSSARLRLPVKFHNVAMFFVIFDLEAVFLFPWAVAVPELGLAGFIGAMSFLLSLAAALAYLWRLGALDWGP